MCNLNSVSLCGLLCLNLFKFNTMAFQIQMNPNTVTPTLFGRPFPYHWSLKKKESCSPGCVSKHFSKCSNSMSSYPPAKELLSSICRSILSNARVCIFESTHENDKLFPLLAREQDPISVLLEFFFLANTKSDFPESIPIYSRFSVNSHPSF